MSNSEKTKVLTPKQERFCQEYTIDFNGSAACVRAGYSKRTANRIASRLLSKVDIQQFIQNMQLETSESLKISREKVVAEYAKLAFFDIRKVLTVDGGLKETSEWDDDSAAAIAGLESYDEIEPDSGMVLGKIRKIKISDKRAALDSICRVLGYNAPEKSEVKFDAPLSDIQVNLILQTIKLEAKTVRSLPISTGTR